MEHSTNKIDDVNYSIKSTLSKKAVDEKINAIAKDASKTMHIQGFRKGKVPIAIVKQRYGSKIVDDAQNDLLRDLLTHALKKLDIVNDKLAGEPTVGKMDKKDDGTVEVEIKISLKPDISLENYKDLIPEITPIVATEDEILEDINKMASSQAPMKKIAKKRMVRKGDFVKIDFEGFKNGVAFDGGKADGHVLEIGSNSFIPGFEDQIIGMKYEEKKDIEVTFPKDYQSKDLAGSSVVFKVNLHEIQEKSEVVLNDELAKILVPNEKDVTLEILKEKVKTQIESRKKSEYYNNDLKPIYIEELVKNNDFKIPQNILDQEINQVLNNDFRTMGPDAIKELQEDPKKMEKMREDVIPQATKSVKATFIVDKLAKLEKVDVTDKEVSQAIYYEAMMNGQDGVGALKKYEEMGYLPAIKLSMIEQKVITKLFDGKLEIK